ncbi:MAG TPA: alpha/beta hydrolase [Nocardioidaceae bacterium]|nr:alpha/beta hydrolase [Nocardioidaceae bacterium]
MTRLPALCLVLLLSACSLLGGDELEQVPIGGEPTLDGVPRALWPYYQQTLDWRECRGSFECATLEVPLDYAKPRGRTLELSVLRRPADGDPIGSLVVNPGGPGGSGVGYAAAGSSYFGRALLRSFDVVGLDPRGVGESSPVECVGDDQLDAFIASDPDPDSKAEFRRGHRLARAFFAGCMRRDPALAQHVSTVEVARDLDVLRFALGHAKLTYFGASYGTFLGATYADLFPANAGRLVLDGAIDPTLSNVDESLAHARGFETALRAYVGACVEAGSCFLGDSVDDGAARIATFLQDLDSSPIAGSADRQLTEGLALYGIWAPLYDRGYWDLLDNALQAAFEGDGSQLLALSDAYTRRGPFGYTDNTMQALIVVNCLDHDDPVPDSEIPALLPRFEEASPTFGRILASGLGACGDWSVDGAKGGKELVAAGSAPILVVGTTRDPATPYEWAVALAEQLENGVLLSRDGDGHTGYRSGNACVDDVVERYLVSGIVPEDGTDC